jgi:hypothetical protein
LVVTCPEQGVWQPGDDFQREMPQPRPDDAAPFSRAQASRNAARAAAEAILVNGNGRRAASY